MAKPVRKAEQNGGKTAAERAKEHLGGKPRVVEALASERDAQHWLGQLKKGEKSKTKAYAEADQIRSEAKADLDKIYADAVDALKSRGITKRLLKDRVAEEARKDDEVSREHNAKLWLGRATQSPWAQTTFTFDEPVKDAKDAQEKAKQRGFDDSAEGKTAASPYQGNQTLDRAYMAGYHENQGSRIKGGAKSEGAASVN